MGSYLLISTLPSIVPMSFPPTIRLILGLAAILTLRGTDPISTPSTLSTSQPSSARQKRLSVPDKREVQSVVEMLRESVADELAEGKTEEALTRVLEFETVGSVELYGSLVFAGDLAVELGDLHRVRTLAKKMGQQFESNEHTQCRLWMVEIANRTKDKQAKEKIAMAFARLTDRAILDLELDEASSARRQAMKLTKNRALEIALVPRKNDVTMLEELAKRANTSRSLPAADQRLPDNQATFGREALLLLDDWPTALGYLVNSSDPLASIARRDLDSPVGFLAQRELADKWLEWADASKRSWLTRFRFQERAVYWLDEASSSGTDIERNSIKSLLGSLPVDDFTLIEAQASKTTAKPLESKQPQPEVPTRFKTWPKNRKVAMVRTRTDWKNPIELSGEVLRSSSDSMTLRIKGGGRILHSWDYIFEREGQGNVFQLVDVKSRDGLEGRIKNLRGSLELTRSSLEGTYRWDLHHMKSGRFDKTVKGNVVFKTR